MEAPLSSIEEEIKETLKLLNEPRPKIKSRLSILDEEINEYLYLLTGNKSYEVKISNYIPLYI